MKKRIHKKLKGMTLVECIIAIAVLGITGLIMVRVGSLTAQLMTNTNHVNNKVVVESPAAAAQDAQTINQKSAPEGSDPLLADDQGADVDITVSVSGCTPYTVQTKKYDTSIMKSNSDRNCNTNLNDDLDFYVIQ